MKPPPGPGNRSAGRRTVSVALAEITAGQRHDGVALEWFSDRAHLNRFESWLGTPAGRAVQRLRSEVIEHDASPVVVTSERVARGAEWLDRRWRVGGPKLKRRRGQPARPHRLLRAGARRRRGQRAGARELVPRGQ
jgi:hypothetical protein